MVLTKQKKDATVCAKDQPENKMSAEWMDRMNKQWLAENANRLVALAGDNPVFITGQQNEQRINEFQKAKSITVLHRAAEVYNARSAGLYSLLSSGIESRGVAQDFFHKAVREAKALGVDVSSELNGKYEFIGEVK